MKRLIALAALLPITALAQESNETSYDYFDFNYFGNNWDLGPSSLDGSGYAGRLSVELRDHLFMMADYSVWDFDGVSGSSAQKDFGLGVHFDLGKRWSIFGGGGIRTLDLDLGSGKSQEENGFITGGARLQVADGYEIRVSADYADLTPVRSGETSVTVGGDIYLTDVIALSLDFNLNDDDTTTFMVGMRFYHKKDTSNLRKRR